jgi:hypothetical protein
MRRPLALLPVLAALPFLSGCLWWGYGAGAGASEQKTATVEAPAELETDAATAVRSAIPAIEAYYADTGSYTGMTLELLRARYDHGIAGVALVGTPGDKGYCVEAPPEAATFHFEGPAGFLGPGSCPRP